MMRRREFLGAAFALPVSLAWSTTGCVHKEETPLAHLYGQDWVHGAYGLYAEKYAGIQTSTEDAATNAYALLAQKGIVALEGLQQREVPFSIKVDGTEDGFKIARDVPDRLTFTSDMSDADRQAAQASWEKARDSIQTDYEEIRRLDWALTTLLHQVKRVRSSIDNGTIEQYRLVRQITALQAGGQPPFDLPYQVSVSDYSNVLLLLLERLDDDSKRLSRVESDIVTVGLTARATDSGSGSLSANLHKVLLAVVADSAAVTPRAPTYPDDTSRAQYSARGKELFASISADPAYIQWEKRESTKAFDQLGQMLSLVDSMTGLHVSAIYQQALSIWRGDADYLSYLKSLLSTFPAGRQVLQVAQEAIALTEKARAIVGKVENVVAQVQSGVATGQMIVQHGQAMAGQGLAVVKGEADKGLVQAGKDSGLLNAGSDFAAKRITKQLAFIRDPKELDALKGMMAQSTLLTRVIPTF